MILFVMPRASLPQAIIQSRIPSGTDIAGVRVASNQSLDCGKERRIFSI
jgi:hypothetical protein